MPFCAHQEVVFTSKVCIVLGYPILDIWKLAFLSARCCATALLIGLTTSRIGTLFESPTGTWIDVTSIDAA
jgi:hypothetical protein